MAEPSQERPLRRFVLLVDHGSRSSAANARLGELAGKLQAFLCGGEGPETVVVSAHMELADPDIHTAVSALARSGADEVLLVPCMLSRGKHVSEDIPLLAKSASELCSVRVRLAPPLSELPGFIEFVAGAIASIDGV